MKKFVVLLSASFAVTFFGCRSGSGAEPKIVLSHFFDALAHKNMDQAKKYVTSDSEGMMDMMQMGMNGMADSSNQIMFKKENMDIGEAMIEGDRAIIRVRDKRAGEETDFVLKKESGGWKVAFDLSTLMEMAQKKMKEHGMNGMEGMDNAIDFMDIDSLQDSLQNLSPEEKAHAEKMMDSATKMLQEMQKNNR